MTWIDSPLAVYQALLTAVTVRLPRIANIDLPIHFINCQPGLLHQLSYENNRELSRLALVCLQILAVRGYRDIFIVSTF